MCSWLHVDHDHIVKMHFLSKNLPRNSGTEFRQTKYVIVMTKEGPIKIVNVMTPEAEVLVQCIAI